MENFKKNDRVSSTMRVILSETRKKKTKKKTPPQFQLFYLALVKLSIKHDYIKINRKLIDKNGKVVAAIMAGVDEIDVAWIWKIWVDEEYRHQGLGTLLIKHFEKKAREKGATKILSEEIYDWNINFFLKNGYKIGGELKDLPKGHSFFIIEKDL